MRPLQDKFFRNYFSLKNVNPVIRILTLIDAFVVGGLGLILPIFAIFVVDSIKGGTIETAGLAVTIYLITKSVSQVPVGIVIDKIKGERDDFLMMFLGYAILGVLPLLYIIIETPIQLFLVQFIYGIGGGFAEITWNALFSKHIDKAYAGTEWSVYNTLTDFIGALAAGLGGFIAARFGFENLFILAATVNLMAISFLFLIAKHFFKFKKK